MRQKSGLIYNGRQSYVVSRKSASLSCKTAYVVHAIYKFQHAVITEEEEEMIDTKGEREKAREREGERARATEIGEDKQIERERERRTRAKYRDSKRDDIEINEKMDRQIDR